MGNIMAMQKQQKKAIQTILHTNSQLERYKTMVAKRNYISHINEEIQNNNSEFISNNRKKVEIVKSQLVAEKGKKRNIIEWEKLKDASQIKATTEKNQVIIRNRNQVSFMQNQKKKVLIKKLECTSKQKISNALQGKINDTKKHIHCQINAEEERKKQLEEQLLQIRKMESNIKNNLECTHTMQIGAEQQLKSLEAYYTLSKKLKEKAKLSQL